VNVAGSTLLVLLVAVTTAGSGCLGLLTGERHEPAPDFRLIDIDGRPLNLTDYRGQIVILDMMATWCGPCRAEMSHLRLINQTYGHRNVTILSIGIDSKETDEQLRAFRETHGGTWRFARDTDGVASKYDLGIIPLMVIVDAEGMMRFSNSGETYPATIARVINDIQGNAPFAGFSWREAAWSVALLVLGAATVVSPPYWRRWSAGVRRAHASIGEPAVSTDMWRRRYAPLFGFALVGYAGLAMLAFEFSRPLTGRIGNASAVMGLIALWVGVQALRRRNLPAEKPKKPEDEPKALGDDLKGWLRAYASHIYWALPLFTTVLLLTLSSTTSGPALLYGAAFGLGAAVAFVVTFQWVVSPEDERVRRVGVGASILLIANGAYLVILWFL
jgi:peroxiredoxin